MRYIMKGGVWKNSEDEILKAAIMKYGLNQWSRISSLLQRKSAKQCKQRWYEWLDPSIKKTEWSRTEDEKLLQLARVFPSQWRTIAPFVGRTPTQCFQRYEKLLDLAQGKTGQETEDLKRLRPGQIDPNPETKPARLDPIDMDQDQKEMLAEVRVRLANTKGKKAKRKQREKIIEEARRLAQLQKIRQLEMAGVDNIPTQKEIKRMRQKQDIDYNKEIPFKREVPEFVYKLEDNQTSKNTFFASTISLQTLEGKRRDVEEELQRKLDKKRLKKLKDTDYKTMMIIKNRFEKPTSTPIQLPQPQLNEKDLQDMKKYNITTPLNSIIHNATPYNMTPENKIMLSAKINYSLNHRDMRTPIGQENAEDEQLDHLREMQKNLKHETKQRSVERMLSERVKTPSSNEWEQDRGKVKSLFKNLRKPENVIEFEIPEEDEEQEQAQQNYVLDAEEQQRLEEQKQKALELERQGLRNQALKLNLERIKNIPVSLIPTAKDEIDMMVQRQMINMIYTDAINEANYEFSLPSNHSFQETTPISVQDRNAALLLIEEECKAMGQFSEPFYFNSYESAAKSVSKDFKKKKSTVLKKDISESELEKQKFGSVISNLNGYKEQQKNNEATQKRAKKFLGGYEKLVSTKVQEINSLQQELQNLRMQRETLQLLSQVEATSASARLEEEEKYYKLIYNSI